MLSTRQIFDHVIKKTEGITNPKRLQRLVNELHKMLNWDTFRTTDVEINNQGKRYTKTISAMHVKLLPPQSWINFTCSWDLEKINQNFEELQTKFEVLNSLPTAAGYIPFLEIALIFSTVWAGYSCSLTRLGLSIWKYIWTSLLLDYLLVSFTSS